MSSLITQPESSSILKMRAYKKKKYEDQMGWSAKQENQEVFDLTCQKVKDIIDFKSETDDLHFKNTMASGPAFGAANEYQDETENRNSSARGGYVVEAEEGYVGLEVPRK